MSLELQKINYEYDKFKKYCEDSFMACCSNIKWNLEKQWYAWRYQKDANEQLLNMAIEFISKMSMRMLILFMYETV